MNSDEIKDIVPAIFEKIEKTFKLKTKESKIIKKKLKALKDKRATYQDANDFAIELGDILASAFSSNISAEDLPDGKMYYNIAKRLIEPNMIRNHDLVSEYSKEVQSILNKQANISIQAQKADLNGDRIDKLVNKISEYDSFEQGKWLLNEPIKNFTQAIVDDTIKKNADLHYKAGLRPKIIRREKGNCCDWCKEIVGIYSYPDVPEDIYKRHRYCRCTVDYYPGNGKKQNVWSKQWKDIEKDDKIKERKAIAARSSSIVITKRVRNGELNLKLNKDHFEKHYEGNRRFEDYYNSRIKKGYGLQSILIIDYDEVQLLIYDNYGKGIVTVTKAGKARSEEEFNFHKVIGYYVYDGKKYPTTKGRIIYSKKGSHIIPIKGEYFD